MDDFHWTKLGTEFVKKYPGDSLFLADKILESLGNDGSILEGYHQDTYTVINEIARIYPKEIWEKCAKYLGPPIDGRAFHIKEWLRGHGFFEEKEGTLSAMQPELIWKWVDQDVEERAWYLASFVPKILFKQEGKTCWARELLVKYGDRDDVRRNLMANFSTEGWSGEASLHYQHKRDELLKFREDEDDCNVIKWIDSFVIGLEKQIEHEKIQEERER
jgi:hypothetical protein